MTRQNPLGPHAADRSQAFQHLALIPLFDMVNHEDGPITAFHDPSKQRMEV